MIKRELIESVIAGEPVTRIPCMFWQAPSMYTCPEEQAEKTAAFYEHHDSDIIKINNIPPIPVSSTGRHMPDEKNGSVNGLGKSRPAPSAAPGSEILHPYEKRFSPCPVHRTQPSFQRCGHVSPPAD